MSYSELIVALENIIVDKVAMVPTARGRKHDTSAPMEIAMVAKEDGENASQEGDQRIMNLALQALYERTGKGKWGFSKGQNWNEKGGKGGRDGGKIPGRKAAVRKDAKGKRKAAREKPERVGRAERQDTSQPGAGKEETRTCTPWTKMTVRTPKNQLKMKRICRHDANWKRAKMSSRRK